MKKSIKTVLTFTCAMAVAFSAMADQLTPLECLFIDHYNDTNDFSFESDFAHMAHFSDIGRDCVPCYVPLRRRSLDVTISVLPHSNMATLTNASYGLSRFIDLLVQSTDLSVDVLPIGEMNLATGGTLALFFVDQETHGELLADFESDQLLRAVLNSFESPETNCALSTFDWNEQSEPAYAFFNILHEVDLEAQTNCIMDMAFRSVGMGGAPQGTRGIFSIPDWVGSHPEDSSLLDYGDRDRMFIDLFFRDEFEVGQEHAETLAEISGIVERECP